MRLSGGLCFFAEGGGLEENGVGEEPEEDRAAQPGALHGHTLLPPGHEPLWRHGRIAVSTHWPVCRRANQRGSRNIDLMPGNVDEHVLLN